MSEAGPDCAVTTDSRGVQTTGLGEAGPDSTETYDATGPDGAGWGCVCGTKQVQAALQTCAEREPVA